MDDIGALSASCLRCFVTLVQSLSTSSEEFTKMMPPGAIDNQYARFKIWAGNLDALRRGRSSLDARLRDSVVLRAAVLKLLGQLQDTLTKSAEITTGVRLPYERDLATGFELGGDDTPGYRSKDLGSISDTSSEPDAGELTEGLSEIEDVMDHLYRLSFKIRNTRYRSLNPQALLMKDEDPDTGKDLFSAYAVFDRRHVKEVLESLRRPPSPKEFQKEPAQAVHHNTVDLLDTNHYSVDSNDYLTDRLSKAITDRRRYFRYWQKHALKLSLRMDEPAFQRMASGLPILKPPRSTSKPDVIVSTADNLISPDGPKRAVSGTDFSRYNTNLDDQLDTETVISYTTTAFDLDGKSPEFPPPPDAAEQSEEHIRQDLQPYVCTYEECPDADHLYASRHAWLEHERLVHRRVWRCFEHKSFSSKSRDSLFQHFSACHQDLHAQEIENLLDLAETALVDERTSCPFCHSDGPFEKGFHNHMAFHQEQLATFAVPRNLDSDESSKQVLGFGSGGSLLSISLDFTDKDDSSKSSDAGTEPEIGPDNLFVAAETGNVPLLKRLLADSMIDADSKDPNLRSALSYAAAGGHEEIIKLLLNTHRVDADSKDVKGRTPLSYAAAEGHEEIVKLLLNTRRMDVNSQDKDDATHLYYAAEAGSGAVTRILLDTGADVNAQGGSYGNALQAACVRGGTDTVQLLLEAGADINAQGGRYGNALQAACVRGGTDTVRLLLEAGADINAQGGYYGNALQAACVRGGTNLIRILLDAGVDINAQGGFHGNAFQAACDGGYTNIVRLLLEAGAHVNAQGGDFPGPVNIAVEKGFTEVEKLLRDAGARDDS
ncbi:hypothetical protein AYL99_08896 [Fonsecaea erecta]|uniref:Uncharacterized protein n=1 Tax=Fonsecaea erecta TaxID=1367422 RepID=A0A178ZAI2_9EURO|nr:hypothetical protein AYL99_08896 [Fonsecaea erecta]OAP56784.1 hypothetical protein AYL99_08896 [Fonsecaea erecta]